MLGRARRRDAYGDDFTQLCSELAAETASFRADVVVGIETGGALVAKKMLPHLPDTKYVSVRIQRPATAVKTNLRAGALLARLPRVLVDFMRWLEVEMRELALRRRPADVTTLARDLASSPDVITNVTGARRVLVVDDTVDSGRTLTAATAAVRLRAPSAEVRTAVLASTWRRPPVRPDHCLLDRTLLRIPTSFDASGHAA